MAYYEAFVSYAVREQCIDLTARKAKMQAITDFAVQWHRTVEHDAQRKAMPFAA
jgi:hypothetical protein